jgi:hypothetical protein
MPYLETAELPGKHWFEDEHAAAILSNPKTRWTLCQDDSKPSANTGTDDRPGETDGSGGSRAPGAEGQATRKSKGSRRKKKGPDSE